MLTEFAEHERIAVTSYRSGLGARELLEVTSREPALAVRRPMARVSLRQTRGTIRQIELDVGEPLDTTNSRKNRSPVG